MDKGESEMGDRESHLVIGAEDGQSWKPELFIWINLLRWLQWSVHEIKVQSFFIRCMKVE